MKNFLKINMALSLIFVMASCSNQDTVKVDDVVRIDLDSLTSINDNGEIVSEYVESVEFCKLEQTEDCLLGDVKKVVETDSLLLVMDETGSKDGNKRLYAFDKKGNLKYQVSGTGGGPGEYTHLKTFCVNSDTVYLLDGYSGKLMSFDLDGRYVKTSSPVAPGKDIFLIDIKDIYAFGKDDCFFVTAEISYYNAFVDGVYYPFTGKKFKPLYENPFDRSDCFVGGSGNKPILADNEESK